MCSFLFFSFPFTSKQGAQKEGWIAGSCSPSCSNNYFSTNYASQFQIAHVLQINNDTEGQNMSWIEIPSTDQLSVTPYQLVHNQEFWMKKLQLPQCIKTLDLRTQPSIFCILGIISNFFCILVLKGSINISNSCVRICNL